MIDRPYISVSLLKGKEVRTEPVYQYDHGLRLRLEGMDIQDSSLVQFSHEGMAEAVSVKGVWDTDVCTAPIPDEQLMQEKDIVAFVYNETSNSGMTDYVIRIPIIPRQKPTPAYTPEQIDNYSAQVLELVNTIEKIEQMRREAQQVLDRAEEAVGIAAAWANVTATAKTLETGSVPTVEVVKDEEGNHVIEFGIPTGATGGPGDPGEGIPAGGNDGQILIKTGSENHKTKWEDLSAIGVTSINNKRGDIYIATEDIEAVYQAPVTEVNGKKGKVSLKAQDVSALAIDGTNAMLGPLRYESVDGAGGAVIRMENGIMLIRFTNRNNTQDIAIDSKNACLYRIDETGMPKKIYDAGNKPTPEELGAMPNTYTPPVNSVNNQTGDVWLNARDIHARSDDWIPGIDEIPDLRAALNKAGKIKTVNQKLPDENGDLSLSAEDVYAADKDHDHEKLRFINQDVTTEGKPTFDEVTANRVIGAVYM